MTLTTLGIAAHVTPTVIKTFFRHFYTQAKKGPEDRRTEATDEFLFHQAFVLVKRFIEFATHDSVESLQTFTNTYVPLPPWATSVPVLIPLSSCNEAAKVLIDYFGPEDLKNVVGGERWWQIRGLSGVEGEWIAQTAEWRDATRIEKFFLFFQLTAMALWATLLGRKSAKKPSPPISPETDGEASELESTASSSDDGHGNDVPPEELDRLERVMLYIHGGGYYFGSVNTHRFMLIRFARKFGGRVFAVNYRKAPGYPWPCPLQDALAAYLYLTQPPPDATHKAVDPRKLVIAGDSAGGGLSLALLATLRDMNLPMPAGAVLISPWCDMTHSFESILQNTETDIMPKFGLIHKPSTLWPVPAVASLEEDESSAAQSRADSPQLGVPSGVNKHNGRSSGGDAASTGRRSTASRQPSSAAQSHREAHQSGAGDASGVPAAPKSLAAKPLLVPVKGGEEGEVVELRAQIQLYATNEQLYHPLCSPVLQGSLGGLPPLYILCGDSEVLRDEVIYLAHRAAEPARYPLSEQLLAGNARARENAERFNHVPTKVHLQVYDEQCHVFTLFAFTTSALYAYRGVASFVKHVTGAATSTIDAPTSATSAQTNGAPKQNGAAANGDGHRASTTSATNSLQPTTDSPLTMEPNGFSDSPMSNSHDSAAPKDAPKSNGLSAMRAVDGPRHGQELRDKKRLNATSGSSNTYDGNLPVRRPSSQLIRERICIRGNVRPLEPEELLQALRMARDEIGVIKEGPVRRYLDGQKAWDDKFAKEAKRVEKRRARNEAKAHEMLKRAAKMGLLEPKYRPRRESHPTEATSQWTDLARFGPLDILNETPPPSAIVGRRDTADALSLLQMSLRMRELESGVQKQRRSRLNFRRAPHQSAAERQVRDDDASHGLNLWSHLLEGSAGIGSTKPSEGGAAGSRA